MNNQVIDTLGNIIKEEFLISLENKVMRHTLVLENREAFPGYYHNMPGQAPPHSVFLVTQQPYSREDITRASQKIHSRSGFSFDASTGQLHVRHEVFFCIRLLSLEAYSHIEELQTYFQEEGILFRKFERIQTKGLIKVKKFFTFEILEPDFYLDMKQDFTGFFRIPDQLSWVRFEALTHQVKNNWTDRDFDAALASAYINHEIHDLVRIYSKELNLSLLRDLADRYRYALSRE
jgi:hypothetical protein